MRPLFHFVILFFALPLWAQSNVGELRLKAIGPDGNPFKAFIDLSSDAIQFHRSFSADDAGLAVVRNLPFGVYRLEVHEPGFAAYDGLIEIRSALPTEYVVKLSIAALSTAVNVTADATLLDPERTTAINHIDSKAIAERPASLPGRSLPDLINTQPGWLYEGNAVLHPRGSEYQTQFVVDGIPLTDNRSPSFGPDFKAGFADPAPVSNADIAPTIARILGLSITPHGALEGRPIVESLRGQPDALSFAARVLESTPANGKLTVLQFQEAGGERYFDRACYIDAASATGANPCN